MHYGLYGAITREDPAILNEVPEVIEAGVPTFKMFTAYEIGLSNGFMNRLAEDDAVGVFHTEDTSVCEDLVAQFKTEDKSDATWFPKSRPDYSEAMAAEGAVRMAVEAGMQYYGKHTSCRKSAGVPDDFQDEHGSELVRAGTCLHYTTLGDSICEEVGNRPVIQLSIRGEDDIGAIFEHLDDGVLSVVSTDHCVYRRKLKEGVPWLGYEPAGNALQTSLSVSHNEAVNRRGHDPSLVVEVMCSNPARTFGMPDKGTLEPGTDADIVVFDLEQSHTVTAADNVGAADYTIYEGREVTGQPSKTFVRGELVATDGVVISRIFGDRSGNIYCKRIRPVLAPVLRVTESTPVR